MNKTKLPWDIEFSGHIGDKTFSYTAPVHTVVEWSHDVQGDGTVIIHLVHPQFNGYSDLLYDSLSEFKSDFAI